MEAGGFTLTITLLSEHCVYRYVDRLTANLRKLTQDAGKMMSLSRLMSTRHAEAIDEQKQLEPQLGLLRQRTKELQKQVQ